MFVQRLHECICSLYSLQNLTHRNIGIKQLPAKIGNLISLKELLISGCFNLKVWPESFCQLKALRKLFISSCSKFKELPNNIGNLVSLEELQIEYCCGLEVLPGSLCQLKSLRKLSIIYCELLKELPSDMGKLTNLQTLEISNTGVSYIPPSLSKFVGIQAVKVKLKCETIGWLKDIPDLGGTLCICGLRNITNLMDVQCANLVNLHNLEHLMLSWIGDSFRFIDSSGFMLITKSVRDIFLEDQSCFLVMVSLEPHPNLTKLQIYGYGGRIFPEWIGNLCKLRYLKIAFCNSLLFLEAESLPLQLQELEIYACWMLVSMTGMQKLKSLVKLSIVSCLNLNSVTGPSIESHDVILHGRQNSYRSSVLGLTNLASLRSLKISNCFKLKVSADELIAAEPCKVEVSNCGLE